MKTSHLLLYVHARRGLGVGLFFVFIFVVVPKLGPSGFQNCKSAAAHSNLETLDDLQAFLQLLAEEQAHDAEKAKHLLSLAQQIGSSAASTATASHAASKNTPHSSQQLVSNATATAAATAAGQQYQQKQAAGVALMLARSQSDLVAARKVILKHEELLQQQLQQATQLNTQIKQLQQQLMQQQPALGRLDSHAAAAATAQPAAAAAGEAAGCARAADAAAVHAMAISGDACGVLPEVEWGGDVVIWGTEHKTATAGACCAACLAHSRAIARGVGSDQGPAAKPCNVWVHCSNAAACGSSYQECWLKHEPHLTTTAVAAAASSAAAAAVEKGGVGSSKWTSGVPTAGQPVAWWQAQQLGLPAQAFALNSSAAAAAAAGALPGTAGVGTSAAGAGVGALPGAAAAAPVMVWTTALGDIHVQLLPELAPGSVRELLRLGALLTVDSNGYCSDCRIYRAEPGFLVQGIVEAPGGYVAVPRNPNPPQRHTMQRGLVCWAGGGGGPDWFVNLIDQSGFGDQHLCFGQVNAAGLAVFEAVLKLPLKPKAEGVEMALLKEDVRFNLTLQAVPTPKV